MRSTLRPGSPRSLHRARPRPRRPRSRLPRRQRRRLRLRTSRSRRLLEVLPLKDKPVLRLAALRRQRRERPGVSRPCLSAGSQGLSGDTQGWDAPPPNLRWNSEDRSGWLGIKIGGAGPPRHLWNDGAKCRGRSLAMRGDGNAPPADLRGNSADRSYLASLKVSCRSRPTWPSMNRSSSDGTLRPSRSRRRSISCARRARHPPPGP